MGTYTYMVLSIACTVQSAGSKYLEVVTSKNSKIRRRITVPWQYHPRRWWRREWFIFLIPKEASVSTNKIPSWKFSNQEMKFFKVDNFLQNHFYACPFFPRHPNQRYFLHRFRTKLVKWLPFIYAHDTNFVSCKSQLQSLSPEQDPYLLGRASIFLKRWALQWVYL